MNIFDNYSGTMSDFVSTFDYPIWFEWNGVKSTEYGIIVLTQPSLISAKERMSRVSIPGRSGSLTIKEGANVFDDVTFSITCTIEDPLPANSVDQVSRIATWLRGYGRVRFANRPDSIWFGRIINQLQFDKIVSGNPNVTFSLQFQVEPFYYLSGGLTPVTIVPDQNHLINISDDPENPNYVYSYTLVNSGNIPSQPTIVVSGTDPTPSEEGNEESASDDSDDDVTSGFITCGNTTLYISSFAGVGSIVIDCKAKYAYTEDNSGNKTLLNGRLSGDWIEVPVGEVQLLFSDTVTGIGVIGYWRCI